MPLSSPSGGSGFGIENGNIFALRAMRNAGSDTSINFGGCIWHEPTQQIIAAGDNDYVGVKANAYARLMQNAVLPVAAASPCRGLCLNRVDNGVLYWDAANAYFRAPADLSVWTALGALAGTRGGIASFNNGDLISLDGTFGNEQYQISHDNGATWPDTVNFGAFMPNQTAANSLFITSPDGSILLIGGSGNFLSTTDPTNAAAFELYVNAGSLGQVLAGAISTDNQRAVVTSNQGGVTVIQGGLTAGNETSLVNTQNVFQNITGVGGQTPNIVHYSEAFGGFFLFAATGNLFGFLPDDDMLNMQQGLMIGPDGITFSSAISPMGCSASDADGNIYVPCNAANVELVSFVSP